MPKFFDVGMEAVGVIAIGQFATGVFAFGQSALGVVAVGQLARGVVTVGQVSIGAGAVGQIALVPGGAIGMLGLGGVFGGASMLGSDLRFRADDSAFARSAKVLLTIGLLVALWFAAVLPWHEAFFPDTPPPPRVLR